MAENDMKQNEHSAMSRADFCGLLKPRVIMRQTLAEMIVVKKKSILNNGAFPELKMKGGRVSRNGAPNGRS